MLLNAFNVNTLRSFIPDDNAISTEWECLLQSESDESYYHNHQCQPSPCSSEIQQKTLPSTPHNKQCAQSCMQLQKKLDIISIKTNAGIAEGQSSNTEKEMSVEIKGEMTAENRRISEIIPHSETNTNCTSNTNSFKMQIISDDTSSSSSKAHKKHKSIEDCSHYYCNRCGSHLCVNKYISHTNCSLVRSLSNCDRRISHKVHQLSFGSIDYLFVFGAFVFGSKFMPITILISIFIVNISGFLFTGICCTCTVIITQFLKKIIARHRPDPKSLAPKILDFRTRLTNFAFPSGDTAQVYMCLYPFIYHTLLMFCMHSLLHIHSHCIF